MMVLVVTAAPAGLRGELTRWLMEIDAGVFVGNPSSRVREALWARTRESIRDGRALLVYRTNSEQRLRVETHRHHWTPGDFDGLTLMRRPLPTGNAPNGADRRTGWSNVRNRQRSLRPAWRRSGAESE
ncbi:type I-E CRISPR-associated endoribonuclease Cas2 [Micrococcus luteus]|nr:type I-E CRISPR-associated endoribonuclease Cas2 [Micrococcus luteus]